MLFSNGSGAESAVKRYYVIEKTAETQTISTGWLAFWLGALIPAPYPLLSLNPYASFDQEDMSSNPRWAKTWCAKCGPPDEWTT
jgi:hypothetical protein